MCRDRLTACSFIFVLVFTIFLLLNNYQFNCMFFSHNRINRLQAKFLLTH